LQLITHKCYLFLSNHATGQAGPYKHKRLLFPSYRLLRINLLQIDAVMHSSNTTCI